MIKLELSEDNIEGRSKTSNWIWKKFFVEARAVFVSNYQRRLNSKTPLSIKVFDSCSRWILTKRHLLHEGRQQTLRERLRPEQCLGSWRKLAAALARKSWRIFAPLPSGQLDCTQPAWQNGRVLGLMSKSIFSLFHWDSLTPLHRWSPRGTCKTSVVTIVSILIFVIANSLTIIDHY